MAQIGPVAMVPHVTIAGRVFTDLVNLIALTAGLNTTNTTCTFRRPGATAGYQVPVGYKLVLEAWTMEPNQGANHDFYFAYADADVGVGVTALTNPVYFRSIGLNLLSAVNASGMREYSGYMGRWEIPAGKYACMVDSSAAIVSGFVSVFGYLEAV